MLPTRIPMCHWPCHSRAHEHAGRIGAAIDEVAQHHHRCAGFTGLQVVAFNRIDQRPGQIEPTMNIAHTVIPLTVGHARCRSDHCSGAQQFAQGCANHGRAYGKQIKLASWQQVGDGNQSTHSPSQMSDAKTRHFSSNIRYNKFFLVRCSINGQYCFALG